MSRRAATIIAAALLALPAGAASAGPPHDAAAESRATASSVRADAPVTASTRVAAASLTLRASARSVEVGDTVVFTGRVVGSYARGVVTLERKVSAGWRTVSTDRVKRGTFTRALAQRRAGATTYRVVGTLKGSGRTVVSSRLTISVAAPPMAGTELNQVRARILSDTNAYRASKGLAPLLPMPELDRIAQVWTERMASTSTFEHSPDYFEQYPPGWTQGGENIAAGYPVESVVDGWWDSPGHRANMLGDYTHLGIGYAEGGSFGRYYTQNFAKYP